MSAAIIRFLLLVNTLAPLVAPNGAVTIECLDSTDVCESGDPCADLQCSTGHLCTACGELKQKCMADSADSNRQEIRRS